MKKIVNLAFAIVLVLGILLVNVPPTVEAKDTKVAEGAWNTGTEVDVDATVPDSLNLLTKGVKVTKPGLICHPFNGGRFGWVGEIRQLVKGNWVKLATTNDWVPDTEGEFMSCAQAPAAGTYALFGYWIRPANYVEEAAVGDTSTVCSTYVVNPDGFSIPLYIYSRSAQKTYLIAGSVHFIPEVPTGTLVSYTVSSSSPGFVGGGTRNVNPVAATDIGLGISGFVDFLEGGQVYAFYANVADIGDFDFVYHIDGCGDVPYHVSLPRDVLGH